MELFEPHLRDAWLTAGVALCSFVMFFVADRCMLASLGKATTLAWLGAWCSLSLVLADCTTLVAIAASGLQVLWVLLYLVPGALLILAILWVPSLRGARMRTKADSIRSWFSGLAIASSAWVVGSLFSGSGFAINGLAILLPSIVIARRVCIARFPADPAPAISPQAAMRVPS